MISLERDILTKIQHKDGSIEEAKLNAAYAGGGAELAIETIQKMMNLHIDRYINGQYARIATIGRCSWRYYG